MRIIGPSTIFACVLLLMSTSFCGAASYHTDGLITRFETMDQAINKGEGYSKSNNEGGSLAWSESYILEAYLDMFEATRNRKYLDSFVRHADRVVANTDQERGIADYKGRSAVGWSCTKYSNNGQRVVWLAHSGMITYPLLRFAWLVTSHEIQGFGSQAQRYVDVAKAALSFFDRNWIYDPATGYGYFQFEADEPHTTNTPEPPMPVPFNQQLAAGRAYIMLYKILGHPEHYKKAEALAKHFRGHLKKTTNGAYSWQYWYGKGLLKRTAVEDISHGSIDVDFAILAHRNGIVFNRVDIIRFLQTFTKNISQFGKLATNVDGTGGNIYEDAGGRWLELAAFSNVPWKHVEAIFSISTSMHPQVMLGVAKLLKYYGRKR